MLDVCEGSGIQNINEVTEINGMFTGFAEAEENSNDKAQKALGGMGRGSAAEPLGKVIDKGDGIRNPSRYVITAANRSSGIEESAKQGITTGSEIPLPQDEDDDEEDDYAGVEAIVERTDRNGNR